MEITLNSTALRRLYLMQLSAFTVPRPDGSTMEMSMGCYLVQTADNLNILIDSGMAPDARPSNAPPARNETNVIEQLALLDLQPDDIDIVVCTHFDVDHCGYHDHFKQAEFIVQRAHYELACNGHPRLIKARAHWDDPALRYRMVDGDIELLPGLELIETSGHVAGHQSVLIRLPQTGAVLLTIDAVLMQNLFTPDRRSWPLDDDGEQLVASTRKLIGIAERQRASLVVFGHDGLQWQSLKRAPNFYD
jgi:N-acyl homoserine lactone hydrolase